MGLGFGVGPCTSSVRVPGGQAVRTCRRRCPRACRRRTARFGGFGYGVSCPVSCRATVTANSLPSPRSQLPSACTHHARAAASFLASPVPCARSLSRTRPCASERCRSRWMLLLFPLTFCASNRTRLFCSIYGVF